MGWGELHRPRPHPAGGIVVEVAAADHLAKVEAELEVQPQPFGDRVRSELHDRWGWLLEAAGL